MKKIFFTFIFTFTTFFINAQVGIETQNPKATLDVYGKPNISTSLDGVIPPRITGDQLFSKTYTTEQNGAIVFVNTPASEVNLTGQTINVNVPGLYYFDGPSLTWIYLGTNPIMSNYRSVEYQALDLTSTNDQTITFKSTDAVVDLATEFNDTADSFKIKYDGYYQLSAFIGFNANQTNLSNFRDFVAVNLKLKVNGNDATGIRSVYAGITAGTGTSIQVPTTILKLKKDDVVTFVIQRPAITIGGVSNQPFGDFGTTNGHINLPNGQKFTKSITILKIK